MFTLHITILVTTATIVGTSRVRMDSMLIGLEQDSVGSEQDSAIGVQGKHVKSVRGCKSREGCQNDQQNDWQNQDRGLALQKEGGGFTLLAVFDGHSTGGEAVSEALRARFEALFHAVNVTAVNVRWLQTQIKAALIQVNRERWHGGSTAVIAVVLHDQVLVANVGDSRALLLTASHASFGAKLSSMSPMKKVPTVKPLSIDQTPCFEGREQAEDKRIKAHPQCGYVDGYDRRVDPSCTKASRDDIILMYRLSTGLCGARFTRSIGDAPCEDCAIPDPVFSVHKLTSSDEYLLLASDGLTEFLENEEIDRLVRPDTDKGTMPQIVDSLITESRAKWIDESNEYVDDITIALAKLG